MTLMPPTRKLLTEKSLPVPNHQYRSLDLERQLIGCIVGDWVGSFLYQ